MTEQNVEERQEPTQAQGEVSDQSLSQEASKSDTDLRAELDSLRSELRGLQGKMDKDANAAAKRIESNIEKRLEQLGVTLTPEQKLQNRVLELEEKLYVDAAPASAKPQSDKEPQKPVDIAKIKQAFSGIDFNDQVAMDAVINNKDNEEAMLLALGKIMLDVTNKPKPTAASVASPSGSTLTADKKVILRQQYEADVAALKARDRGVISPNALDALKRGYRKKGLDIW